MHSFKAFSRATSFDLPSAPQHFCTLSSDGVASRRVLLGVREARDHHHSGGTHLDRIRSHTARAAIRVAEDTIARVKMAVGFCALAFLAIAVLAVGR